MKWPVRVSSFTFVTFGFSHRLSGLTSESQSDDVRQLAASVSEGVSQPETACAALHHHHVTCHCRNNFVRKPEMGSRLLAKKDKVSMGKMYFCNE